MEKIEKKINVGIGFATGRKRFPDVLKTYVNNWNDSDFGNKNIAVHLFIAYDLSYKNTKESDFKTFDAETLSLVASAHYLSNSIIASEAQEMVHKKIISKKEAALIFSGGYAGKRNAILYYAIKNKMDYLIFIDDDEYPVAVVKTKNHLAWVGQEVFATHLKYLPNCDITHGHHCGYISPIPSFEFNENLSEDEFKIFIEAISNDIITWDSIKEKIDSGGVQYADKNILEDISSHTVEEIGGMKFISGANLGINLKSPEKIFAFYNPPKARGEDTFLSTCLGSANTQKVPCYTFHDGFEEYTNLLFGVLPTKLKPIEPNSAFIQKRFYNAAVGWSRYKPLLLYITKRENYEVEINNMQKSLAFVLPKISKYFGNDSFNKILDEVVYYSQHVKEHFNSFQKTKVAWTKIMRCMK
ncbi:MAG: hypothetical protein RUMPE_01291 [Eubacteriales bacterium SKADARSKE-1]|nr:hypothetical protein [Eubacteriales bacterium SKADARSKE-1]